jgi:hypothetical protein
LKETKHEKYIRFLLISLCLLIVIVGFHYAGPSQEADRKRDPHVSVQVLREEDTGRDAVIAVSRMSGDQPLLIIYEIDKDDYYHFNVLHHVELKESIEEMKVVSDGAGIWAKVKKDQWFLFSNRLEMLNQTEHPERAHTTRQVFHYEDSTSRASFEKKSRKIELQLTKKTKPLEIHPLSADDTLWLVVYEDELVLAKSR